MTSADLDFPYSPSASIAIIITTPITSQTHPYPFPSTSFSTSPSLSPSPAKSYSHSIPLTLTRRQSPSPSPSPIKPSYIPSLLLPCLHHHHYIQLNLLPSHPFHFPNSPPVSITYTITNQALSHPFPSFLTPLIFKPSSIIQLTFLFGFREPLAF